MSIPPYLSDILAEATNYYESEESLSHIDVAHEIAHQHDSVIRADEGQRGPLDVLVDIQRIHKLCADELETYRQARNGDYTESVLEAIALRSLEEMINDHLTEESGITLDSQDATREVEYLNSNDESFDTFIYIHVTAKEAIDVDNAIRELLSGLDADDPRADDVQSYLFLWNGGVNDLEGTTVPITHPTDVTVLLEALTRYEPTEADFTARLRHAVLDAIRAADSPFNPSDVDEFKELAAQPAK